MTEEITDNITVPQKHNIVIFEPYFVCSILVVNRALLSQVKYVSKSAVIRLILRHSGSGNAMRSGIAKPLKGLYRVVCQNVIFPRKQTF